VKLGRDLLQEGGKVSVVRICRRNASTAPSGSSRVFARCKTSLIFSDVLVRAKTRRSVPGTPRLA
jgi:hypothetical protein